MTTRGPDEMPQESLARLSGGPRFPTRRGGYSMEAVDAFFDGIERRSADEVRDVQFESGGWRKGYDMEAVDVALDAWQARLARPSSPTTGPP